MAGKTTKDAAGGKGVTPAVQKEAIQFQPAPPGALEALAAQLSAGYGAPQEQNLEYLTNLYRTMSLPKPTQYADPSAGGGSGGSGNNPISGMFGGLLERWYQSPQYMAEKEFMESLGKPVPDMQNFDWSTADFSKIFNY